MVARCDTNLMIFWYECMCICMYVFTYAWCEIHHEHLAMMYVCKYIRMRVCIYACMYVCLYVCMELCELDVNAPRITGLDAWMYTCMHTSWNKCCGPTSHAWWIHSVCMCALIHVYSLMRGCIHLLGFWLGRACVVCLNAFVVDVGSKCCDEPRAVRLLGARCVCLLYGLGAV